MNHKTIKTL